MKTQELRTLAKKAETQPEIVVRKAETNLRQTENSQFKLRLFRLYQPALPPKIWTQFGGSERRRR